ncbi:MAG: type II toxin-antitoxin system RelE/ParE family toxin [Burkholderiales bacterium]|nr:type II toxin-antitoxin system RelE/ParE family toxin [Burkholderiales bacterium]
MAAGRGQEWLRGEVKTPPFSLAARVQAGVLLRQLQGGAKLGLPHSRPMPGIGARCHELRIVDEGATWRIILRLDEDAIVIADVFSKKTRRTPGQVIVDCRRRLRLYDELPR